MSFGLNWFVRIKFACIDNLGFLEAFLKFFTDRDVFTVDHFANRELVEELLLGHRVETI